MSEERDKFRAFLNDRRKNNLKETADKYAKVAVNIRAAVARVAEVNNDRLDELTVKDRAALIKAVVELRKKLDAAYLILLAAQTQV